MGLPRHADYAGQARFALRSAGVLYSPITGQIIHHPLVRSAGPSPPFITLSWRHGHGTLPPSIHRAAEVQRLES